MRLLVRRPGLIVTTAAAALAAFLTIVVTGPAPSGQGQPIIGRGARQEHAPGRG